MNITPDTLQSFNAPVVGPGWNDPLPDGSSTYAITFASTLCEVIPECSADTSENREARVGRIVDGLRTLWPEGPRQLMRDFGAMGKMITGADWMLPSDDVLVPGKDHPFWEFLRMVMRLHAASEAPPDLLGRYHKVQAGDTAVSIAREYTGDGERYPELVAANLQVPVVPSGTVAQPRRTFKASRLRPGMLLSLPGGWSARALGQVGEQPALGRKLSLEEFWQQVHAPGNRASFVAEARAFVMGAHPGDEIWTYDDMGELSGSRGFCLLRKGRIAGMLTAAVS